ncbi:endoglucanase [Frondihabitans sp. PhB188]|uniref:glycoside hydrolase family 6 protein n=1 Tax=Frondihabitans sp. PhB188 TaxID=2485200 RepID=UPI000F49B9E3|nr:glycoside hydrolase family 6 protein [Frondihabitans sp. PhB188]ROQ40025.1 endoglucanase [Frondihabitans sp. PhB188]
MPKTHQIAAVVALAALVLASPLEASAASAATSTKASATTHAASIAAATNRSLFDGGLYVQKESFAAKRAAELSAAGKATDAASAAYIAKRPVAIWLGDWYTGDKLAAYVKKNVEAADKAGKTAVFVTYAIPGRDCGGYSAGGLTPAAYASWNSTIASTLKGHNAVVLVEPDSLGQTTTCASLGSERFTQLKSAVETFAANGIPAYLDGGNSRWLKPQQVADLLDKAGIQYARGFYTNVSNYVGVDEERAYASSVSKLTSGAHYVIDVSRNGRGWKGTWCNAPGAGLGQDPHVTAGSTGLDALLWVKTPGASDGTCNGGPAAGKWFASYANALVKLKK